MTNLTEITTPTMNGPQFSAIKKVSICDTQPVTAEGIRTLLAGSPDMMFADITDSLAQALDLVRRSSPDVLMIDKAFGIQAILGRGDQACVVGEAQIIIRAEIENLRTAGQSNL